ncbi:MAG: hypothetical protein GMKNLPBB_00027 [Myxococcota bacterium]|nr:hypothetical protein [Myxococcota bacterium]
MMNPGKMNVGGQAVLEGVMMRSANSFAVAVRRPNGEIVIKEAPWNSVWERLTFLKKPFLRGVIVLFESLFNGMSALSFSASQAGETWWDPAAPAVPAGGASANDDARKSEENLTSAQIAGMMAVSLLFGLALFVGLPHFLTWGIGQATGTNMDVDTFAFHAVDGVIKLGIFIGYIMLISRMPEIRRVFQYHGAEHKSIFTHENGEELTVENARRYTTKHPRCGTSFIIFVLMVSILMFAIVFPYIPKLTALIWTDGAGTWAGKVADQLGSIVIKILMMAPIAGVSYELTRLAGKFPNNPILRAISAPGLWMQNLTTIEPDEYQLEVAIASLRKTLWREANGPDARMPVNEEGLEVYPSFAAMLQAYSPPSPRDELRQAA